MTTVAEVKTLLAGLAFGESPRWHGDRLWLADWGAQQVVAVDLDGNSEVRVRVHFPSFPMCIDWMPDGRLLVVSVREGLLLRREADGSLVTHANLNGLAEEGHPWNEIVVDGRGNTYINHIGFEFPGGQFAPGIIALLTPDGSARQVADGIAFPNGMAITPDNSTLIVAESYGRRLTAFDITASGGLSNRNHEMTTPQFQCSKFKFLCLYIGVLVDVLSPATTATHQKARPFCASAAAPRDHQRS
jgi:sugar lactone lactonase YvrE